MTAAPTLFDADPFAPVVVRRLVRPGADTAHLFTDRPGWSRSLCRAIPWSAALAPAGAIADCAGCTECAGALGATVTESAVPESELRVLDGNR